jgi:hypothetical protein
LTGTTFNVGLSGSFPVTASGYPNPTFTESGPLPSGVTLASNGLLSGIPAAGTAGTYPIVITATNTISPDKTQPFTLTIGEAPSLTLSSVTVSPGSVQAGGTSTVTLQAVDVFGNDLTVGGLNVAFTLASGNGQNTITAATDQGNGTYTATFTGIIAGSNTIAATIDDKPVTSTEPTIAVTPGPISLAKSQVSTVLPSVQLGGETTIVLQGEDAYGNDETSGGVKGISFKLENTTGGQGTISATTDNNNGTYTATFIGTADGSNTIEATNGAAQFASTAAMSVTYSVANLADSAITLLPAVKKGPVSAQSGVSGAITVTLQAEYGKNEKETSGGLNVAFNLSSVNGGQGTFGPVTYIGNGQYQAAFTGTLVGSNTITATIDGLKVTSKAPSIVVTPGTLSLANSLVTVAAPTDKSATGDTITFQPRDSAGNKLVLKNQVVIFTLGTTSITAKMKSNGTYVATYTGTLVGGSTIVTSVNGQNLTSTPPVITVLPGTASKNTSIVSVTPTGDVPAGTPVTVTLQAIDADGNLETTGGLSVAFSLGKGSSKGKFGKVTYLGNGIYQATFTPAAAGVDTIQATINGAKVKSTVAITVAPAL